MAWRQPGGRMVNGPRPIQAAGLRCALGPTVASPIARGIDDVPAGRASRTLELRKSGLHLLDDAIGKDTENATGGVRVYVEKQLPICGDPDRGTPPAGHLQREHSQPDTAATPHKQRCTVHPSATPASAGGAVSLKNACG